MLHGTWMLTGMTEVWGRAELEPCQEGGHCGAVNEGLHVLTFLFLKNHSSVVRVIKRRGTSKAEIGDTGRNSQLRPGVLGAVPPRGLGQDGMGWDEGARGTSSLGFSWASQATHMRGRGRQCFCHG